MLSRIRRAAFVAVLLNVLFCVSCQAAHEDIRIGAPDGAGEILARYAADKLNADVTVRNNSGVKEYFDCCAASTMWALSSGSLDIAILCPDEARSLVESDERYVILGPCIKNSVVIVVKDMTKTDTIGVAQGRIYQETLVKDVFGQTTVTRSMLIQSLPTAYERGIVDGVVIDIDKSIYLDGMVVPVPGEGVITYLLVARKDVADLDKVKEVFSQAARDLNNADILQEMIEVVFADSNEKPKATRWFENGFRYLEPET